MTSHLNFMTYGTLHTVHPLYHLMVKEHMKAVILSGYLAVYKPASSFNPRSS